ncbi:putative acetyltransferase [Leptospira noguchii serovar Panama str. CZ214]|uniref:Putative acetyltransferase n=2 Tax=Leptospira noguchii TaxID=28182 RepID=T0FKJ8_9LEPT|nr:putative acetyltransferase [Leptospira noguchii serovar Panama str. CZ214]
MNIEYIFNDKENEMNLESNIKLALFSKIMNSSLKGNDFLGLCSCINRSEIGRYVAMSFFSYLADSNVGNYCTFAARVSIGAFSHPIDFLTSHEIGYRDTTASYGETAYKEDPEIYFKMRSVRTIIGNDVWIGDNAVVIKGVKIGNGSIVGAGAIVTKDVEPFSIVAGNPAKPIRKRFSQEIIDRIEESEWWKLSMTELSGVPFSDISKALEIIEERKKNKIF